MAFSSRLLSKSKQVLPTIPDRYISVRVISLLLFDSLTDLELSFPIPLEYVCLVTLELQFLMEVKRKYFLRSEMVNILGFRGLVSFHYLHFLGNQTAG